MNDGRIKPMAWIILALAAGIAIRLYACLNHAPMSLHGDEAAYYDLGVKLANSGSFHGIARAPGYVFFIGVIAKTINDHHLTVRIAQIALFIPSALLLYFLARSFVGRRGARLTVWLFSLYPTFVAYSVLLFAESLHVCLFLGAALAMVRLWENHFIYAAIVAGVLLGAAALVKSFTLLLVPLFALWCFFREKPRPAALKAVVLVFSFALTIFPYALRNHLKYGGWVLIDTSAARTLWHANHLNYKPGFDWGVSVSRRHNDGTKMTVEGKGPVQQYYTLLHQELAFVIKNPGLIIKRVPEKIGAFWNPTSFLQRVLAFDLIPGAPRESAQAVALSILTTLSYALVLFAGIFGLMHISPSTLKTYFLLTLCVLFIVHGVMVAQSRYRLVLMPFFMIFASYLFLNPQLLISFTSWRTWAAYCLTAGLLVMWWPYLPFVLLEQVHPW